jgi:hypothetical protein
MQMSDCKECAGKREFSGVCEHGRRRTQCKDCGVCVGVRARSRAICLTRFLEDKARHVPPRTKAHTVCGMQGRDKSPELQSARNVPTWTQAHAVFGMQGREVCACAFTIC